MSSVFEHFLYYVKHPDGLMYPVAGGVLWPVLVLEVAAMVMCAFELGQFTLEMIQRDRKRSIDSIESAALGARKEFLEGRPSEAVAMLAAINKNWLTKQFVGLLGDGSNLTRVRLVKILTETEMIATKRLTRTRVWVHLAPIIGLMTTLIPLSPALSALARGDVEKLAAELVLAFSTTVIGLLISGFTFVISSLREQAYLADIGDLEYALEIMGA